VKSEAIKVVDYKECHFQGCDAMQFYI